MKMCCGYDFVDNPGWYCTRKPGHDGPHSPWPESPPLADGETRTLTFHAQEQLNLCPHGMGPFKCVKCEVSTSLRTQSKKASLAEAAANTAIGFCISWGATITSMWLLGITMSFHQLWWYTWFMTGVSIARSYCLRRMWNAEWWKRFKGSKS